MAKWADYGISKVRYNQQRTHIVKVLVHELRMEFAGAGQEWTRTQVVDAIEDGETFVTILKQSGGVFRRGEDVHVVMINGVKYIRTDQNRTPTDNLGSLPEF